jgi:type II secretory pathway predicted ATPase ExeA
MRSGDIFGSNDKGQEMLSDVMSHFKLVKEFRNVGYFETDHHKQIVQELKMAIQQGKLIAVAGIVGCGKTTTLKKIRDTLVKEGEIIVAKSLSVEKARVTLSTLMMALFYDLSTEKDFKIPTQSEKRERKLQELITKRKKPVALFIDEAHDLHGNTLIGLKRLIEMVQDCGGTLSVVLAGHPKLKNDLRRSSLEEIGSRTTVFDLDGIAASKRGFIEWLLQKCTKSETDIHSILTEEAIDLLAERLLTPLQIEHHLTLALEEAYLIGETPVSENVIESILAKDIDDLESKLTRHGYNVKTLAGAVNVQPKVIRSFLRKKLSPGQSQEIKMEMLAVGIPL